MKKTISKILKFLLPNNVYYHRRDNYFFILYSHFELFIKTLLLRFSKLKYIFLPSRHIGAIFLLNKMTLFFKKNKINFFLWDACLLGVERNQKAIAGTASDIDLGIIFNKKKDLKIILSLKNDFKLRFHNNLSSVQLFHKYGTVDISLFSKIGSKLTVTFDIPIGKEKNTRDENKYYKKKLYFKLYDFIPFLKKKMYSKYYLIPINYTYLLKKKYGKNWKFPDKKEQLYYV